MSMYRITITVPFRQLDLLKCSCDFLHLATWSKRHHIRGITCRGEEGRATSVHTLGKLCSLKQNNNPSTPLHDFDRYTVEELAITGEIKRTLYDRVKALKECLP